MSLLFFLFSPNKPTYLLLQVSISNVKNIIHQVCIGYLINNKHTEHKRKNDSRPLNARYGLASFPVGYPYAVQWKTVLLEEKHGH